VTDREYSIQIACWALHLWTIRRRQRDKPNWRPERFRQEVEYALRRLEKENPENILKDVAIG